MSLELCNQRFDQFMENFLALAITTWIFKCSVVILNFVVMWGILNNIITFQYLFSFLKMNILWTHAVFKVVEPDSRSTQSDSKSMARTISSQGETTTESRLRFSLEDSSSQVTNAGVYIFLFAPPRFRLNKGGHAVWGGDIMKPNHLEIKLVRDE